MTLRRIDLKMTRNDAQERETLYEEDENVRNDRVTMNETVPNLCIPILSVCLT